MTRAVRNAAGATKDIGDAQHTAAPGRSGCRTHRGLPARHRGPSRVFHGVGDPDHFVPLPDEWSVGIADVVGSTEAIAGGGYKSVNTAGASVISAVSNALGTLDFPFIFAGDGASFAVAAADAAAAEAALAATIAWVGEALGLRLRGAMVAVRTMRDEGLDVQVARFSASPDVAYCMFAGGGLAWAERRLKAGELILPTAPPGARPDLSGLSCRFQDVKAKHGVILSMLVRPLVPAEDGRFRTLVADVLGIVETGAEAAKPIPVFKPAGGMNFRSIALNGRLDRRRGERPIGSFLRSAFATLLAFGPARDRRNSRGLFGATLLARSRRQFGFPQVRRRADDDARLRRDARRCARKAAGDVRRGRGSHLRPASAGLGDRDLRRALGDSAQTMCISSTALPAVTQWQPRTSRPASSIIAADKSPWRVYADEIARSSRVRRKP